MALIDYANASADIVRHGIIKMFPVLSQWLLNNVFERSQADKSIETMTKRG